VLRAKACSRQSFDNPRDTLRGDGGHVEDESTDRWDAGGQAVRRSLGFVKDGRPAEAFQVLDNAIAQAGEENRSIWVRILCRHAGVLAHARGDVAREIRYAEHALPHTKDYRFALYNFAQLLRRGGQVVRADRCAAEAYKLALSEQSEADHDLLAAILKEWPELAHSL
jgi:hypothetical protein